MKKPKKSIQRHFLLNVLMLVGGLLILHAVLNAVQIKNSMEEQVRENLASKAGDIAGEINQRFVSFSLKTEYMAAALADLDEYDEATMYRILGRNILSDPMIVGGGFWFKPGGYAPDVARYCGYLAKNKDGGVAVSQEYVHSQYDYSNTDWYRKGIRTHEKAAWNDTYRDEVTGVLMVTSACGIWKNDRIDGCVTLDVGIEEMEDYIRTVMVGKTGQAFFVREDGVAIGLRSESLNRRLNITMDDYPGLAELGRKILASQKVNIFEADVRGVSAYVIAAPLMVSTLKLVMVAPKADYNDIIWRHMVLSAVMVVLVMAALVVAIRHMFRERIYAPLNDLVTAADTIATGNAVELKSGRDDEISLLADSMLAMSGRIKRRNKKLQEQYALLEAKNHDLEVALANVESMRLARDSYKAESETDKLTGLLNKAATTRFIEDSLRLLPKGRYAALYIVDLDHFKEANDTYGHQYGDSILRCFAAALRHNFRPSDIIGRFGGDEFVVLVSGLPNVSIAERKAEQMLAAARTLTAEDRPAGVTASIGIAVTDNADTPYDALFTLADKSLYKVKAAGRDGYSLGLGEVAH
ncbi:MAG: diguanylate cyclase [Selenomonadaceae bacterium]|nr:diguanylate cyclase [Selenomonadaceae bacterium]